MNTWFTSDTHAYHKNICRGVSSWENSETRDFQNEFLMTEQMIQNINDNVKWNDTLYHLGDWSFAGFDNIKKFRDQINCRNIHLILGNHDHHIDRNKNDIRSIFSSVNQFISITKICGQKMSLCHFPLEIWDKHHHGTWMLHGHCHGSLPISERKVLDVGIDCHNEFRPFHFDEIESIMKDRVIDLIDHHKEIRE